jgi:hypothetical protein
MEPAMMTQPEAPITPRRGLRVRDQYGAWTLGQDSDGNWVADQGASSVLLLYPTDFARFGLAN